MTTLNTLVPANLKLIKFLLTLLLSLVIFYLVVGWSLLYLVDSSYEKAIHGMSKEEFENALCWCMNKTEINALDIPVIYRTKQTKTALQRNPNDVVEYKPFGLPIPFVIVYDLFNRVDLKIPAYE